MQRLPLSILTLALLLVAGVTSIQAQQRPDVALLVAECVSRDGLCASQELVRYRIRDDEPVSRDVILVKPKVRYDLGQNHLYRDRYLITHWGDVVDIERKRLLHDGIGNYVSVEGDRVIQYVNRIDVKGFFYYDLKSGKYSRLKSPGKWALPGVLSPDQTKSASVDEFGHGKIWLHTLNGRKRLLASDLRTSAIGCSFPTTQFVWLSNQSLLTERADGELVIVDLNGRVEPLLTLPLKASEYDGRRLYRDDAGRVLFAFGHETYAIDVDNKQYSLVDTHWSDLGSGFEWETHNGASGRMVRFQGGEIGRWWSLSMRATTGHIAVEYADVGYLFGKPKGLKVWSSSNKKWTTIDPAWLTRTIGWIEERPHQRHHKSEMQQHVKKTSAGSRAKEAEILYFQFQRPYDGYEGPNFTELDGEPSAEAQYLVRAELFGQETISTVRFELVDENGDVIQPVHLFKYDNSLASRGFAGFVNVPKQPFRVAISGVAVDGQPYRRIYKRLFHPTTRPPLPPILPPGIAPKDAKRIAGELIALEKSRLAEFEKRASTQPDALIVMPRVEVSNMTYESFVSQNGNRLGMQLTYDIRFSADGDYSHSLHVFPFYNEKNIRGLVKMNVFSEEINPRPGPPSYATPKTHVDLNTLVKYGSQAWYKAGVVYRCTIKLIPDFVGENVDNTKFCVDEEHYTTTVKSWRAWETIKGDALPVRYRIFINELAYRGETEPFDPPKTYYDGFIREGAVTCKRSVDLGKAFDFGHRADFDGSDSGAGNSRGDVDRFVHVLCFDKEITADLFTRFGKWPISDESFAIANANTRGLC